MVDTINLLKIGSMAGECLPAITNCLESSTEIINRDTGEIFVSGKLGNLKVNVSCTGISVKGSLAKFHLSDNTYTLTRHQVQEAMEHLSDCLHLQLLDARITRLDISTHFIMQHRPEDYFKLLGDCKGFTRVQATDGCLYYNPKNDKIEPKKMCFYDKAREVESRNGIMPDVYAGCNVLRYERRWKGRLASQFKVSNVLGCTLFDEAFYHKVVNLWAQGYYAISKQKQLKVNAMNEIKTVSDAFETLVASLISQTDQGQITAFLDELKESKVFDKPEYYSRLKAKIKSVAGKADVTESNELINELDNEIRNIQSYIR